MANNKGSALTTERHALSPATGMTEYSSTREQIQKVLFYLQLNVFGFHLNKFNRNDFHKHKDVKHQEELSDTFCFDPFS